MTELVLTSNARNVLFALLAIADEVSNPDLDERVGLRLHGKDRRVLNENKLVESSQTGSNRSFVHELTDKGWVWCREELSKEAPVSSPPATRVLYELLGGVDRYLRREDLTLAQLFSTASDESGPTPTTLSDRILATHRSLAGSHGGQVPLADLRDELADVDRSKLDAALEELVLADRASLVPEVNRKVLSARERQAAVTMGGESREYLVVGDE